MAARPTIRDRIYHAVDHGMRSLLGVGGQRAAGAVSAPDHPAARYVDRQSGKNAPYKLARPNQTRPWEPDPVAGDTAIFDGWDRATGRARDLVRNTPQFRKARAALVDLVVGQGMAAFSDPFSPHLDFEVFEDIELLRRELRYAYECDVWFDRWANDPQQCDVDGKLSWWDMQRLAFQETVEVGSCVLLRCQRAGRNRITPICFQLLEAEQLDRDMDRPGSATSNKIVGGIELDSIGGTNRPVAYYLFDVDHPDDYAYSPAAPGSSRRIPADRVIHPFIKFRPSAHHGYSWFAAMAQLARDRDWLIGSELTKAAIGTLLGLIHKQKNRGAGGGTFGLIDGEDSQDEHGNPEIKLTSGGSVALGISADDQVEMFEPKNTPSGTLPDFIDILDHDAAGAVNLSHLRYSGRWSKLSYTAGRGAQLDDEMHAKPLKRWWGTEVVLPVRRQVILQMIGRQIQTITPSEFEADRMRWLNAICIGPGREYLDPEGESDSARSRLGAGLSTLQIELGAMGRHWVQVLRQAALEENVMEILGLQLDFSKGGGQQLTGRRASTAGDQSAAMGGFDDFEEQP